MPQKPSYEELEKRAQKLEQAEEELAQIFSMSLDMICIADINTATFIKVNPAFTEILGHSEKTLLEKPFLDFVHPEDRGQLEQAIQRALDHGEPYDMEIRFITATGKHLWTRTLCKPEIVDGKTVKLIGTF